MESPISKTYDVIVVGAGHAGIEAAMAACRLGASTLLLSQNLDTVGQMSCNPAIGGLAKGHMVREIDALGGVMGINADATGIQFRMLNRSKGPSVRAPRVQCDKKAYQFRLKAVLEKQTGLELQQAGVTRIMVENDRVVGVETDFGLEIRGRSVVVTAGTFLRGLLHVGHRRQSGGRMGDAGSPLSDSLRYFGFKSGRFKTGTPCRINARSIDFPLCQRQDGEEPAPRFSFVPSDEEFSDSVGLFTLNARADGAFHVEQQPCWITHTSAKTHQIIRENLDKSALYSGYIEGVGPRYCPSIEDKVVKFPDRNSHQIFLEPEGRNTREFYVNGVSTSMPFEVQLQFIRSIPALSEAEIMRPGYAVEYDYFPPTQVHHTLETKLISRLYFAGQINGTSGYEEAAAQGLVAGANAALKAMSRPEFILDRSEAYIGVLIDDLVTKGTLEPYRMFTSRAEYRLLLRQDNADLRLTPRASEIGLASDRRQSLTNQRQQSLNRARLLASQERVEGHSLLHLMKRPDFESRQIPETLLSAAEPEIWELLATEAKYEGYIRRQDQDIAAFRRTQTQKIPDEIIYERIPSLRNEARQKLASQRPADLAQASRISGITPSDLSIISIWLKSNP